jgi:ribosomal protein L32
MKRPRWLFGRRHSVTRCPECGKACVPEAYCEYCGYDLVERSRADVSRFKPPA